MNNRTELVVLANEEGANGTLTGPPISTLPFGDRSGTLSAPLLQNPETWRPHQPGSGVQGLGDVAFTNGLEKAS